MAESNLSAEQTWRTSSEKMQQILQMLYERISRNDIKEKEMKLMEKFVKGNGPVMGATIINNHFQEVKEELIKQNIPHMAIPGGPDGVLVLVRKEYENQLLAIQEAVAAKDTSLAKELSLRNSIDVLKTQKINNTVVLSFNDKDMAEIAKQKLFQSGSTFATLEDGDKTKLVVFPSSLYKQNGKDLEYFKLNYALTQARGADMFLAPGETEPSIMTARKQQAAYDKKIVEEFIVDAKKGKHVVLGDIRGNGSIYIEAINGEITVHNKDKGLHDKITYLKEDSLGVMYSTLSRHTEKIRNMMNFDGKYYNEKVKDEKISFSDLDAKYKDKFVRPSLSGKNVNIHNFFNNTAELMIEEVNMEAGLRAEAKKGFRMLSSEAKAKVKREEVIKILNDKEFPAIKEFLADDTYGISDAEKEEILDNIIENYSNEEQNTQYSVDVENISVRDLEKQLVAEESKESDIDMQPDIDVQPDIT